LDFSTLATTSILPVDLNTFILKVCLRTLLNRFLEISNLLTLLELWYFLIQMELDIAFFAKVTGDHSTAENFLKASRARQKAIKSVFWNAKMGQWLDYWLNDSTCEVESRYKSLWCLKFLILLHFS
jgi:alpha,alpha-trehalase